MHDRLLIPDAVAPILLTLSLAWLVLALTIHLIYRICSEPYLHYWTIACSLAFLAISVFGTAVWLDRLQWPHMVVALSTVASVFGFTQPAFLLLASQSIRNPPSGRQVALTAAAFSAAGLGLVAASVRWDFQEQEILRYVMAPRNILTGAVTLLLAHRLWHHPRPHFGGVLHKTLCPLLTLQAVHQLFSATQLLSGSTGRSPTSVESALLSTAIAMCTLLGLMYGLTREASRANAAKSSFIATLSHELRTPLAGLVGLTNILSRSRLDRDQQEVVRSMDLCAQSILVMVDDILNVTRIEAGKVISEATAFSPRRLVEDLLLMLRPTLTTAVELTATVDPAVPQAVQGDPRLLRQILLNLVGNAIKFTTGGSVRIEVSHNAVAVPPLLHIRVADTGCGIAAQDIPHLLSPFYQGANVKNSHSRGIGLGLHLCQQWLDILGGSSLQIQSQVGAGSTFSFSIPAPASSLPEAKAPLTPATPPGHLDILVVEDNRINQRVLIRLLESLGHSVSLATNGLDAVKHCEEHSPDLVLMDLIMPGMDGVEATQLIRARASQASQVPILALTASTLDAERMRCLNAGMNDFLTKPVSIDTLAAAVARWSTPKAPPDPSGS